MKKAVVSASIVMLVFAAAMAVAQTEPEKKSSGGNEKMSSAKMESKGGDIQSKLEASERKAWEAFKAKDANSFKSLIVNDAWSVDMGGLMAMDTVATAMNAYTITDYTLDEFKVVRPSKDTAILVYKANATGTYNAQPVPAGPYYCSTVYANRGGKWLGVYHQETLVQQASMPATTK